MDIYKLGVVCGENDLNYYETLQQQIAELNNNMSGQKRKLEVVRLTPDTIDDVLCQGALNGVTYFSEMHTSDPSSEKALQQLLTEQKSIDVYPMNREKSEGKTQHQLQQEESEYISSLSTEANLFPITNVTNENEIGAVTNIINFNAQVYLNRTSAVARTVGDKINALREYVESAIYGKHEYTAGHVSRVSDYAIAIAEQMGYTDERLEQLSLSARLHDIGKLGIVDGILASNKILSFSERNEMSYHTDFGKQILNCLVRNDPALGKTITKDVIEGVDQHHKTWDGFNPNDKAHPIEPNHDDINEFALVICVADCLDTMTSQRAYNSPKNIINAVRDLWGNRNKMFRADISETAIVVLGKELAKMRI